MVCMVAYTLLSYSKEGDIRTIKSSFSPQSYPTRRKIVERMRDLVLYDNYSVKWHKILCLALFTSMILSYYFTGEMEPTTILIITAVIFVAIDIPNRWANVHKKVGLTQEVSMLYTLFNSSRKCEKRIENKKTDS